MAYRRYKELVNFMPDIQFHPFSALRDRFKEGYTARHFQSDLMAALVVAMVALPLSMALAIATGVAPQQGIYTALVAGVIVPILGGSRWQITGPTAAFVVILAPIGVKFGLGGLLTAGFLAGIILVFMGLTGMGQAIRYIPYPVTMGFTTGIGLVIAIIQFKDFFGLTFSHTPESFYDRLLVLSQSFHTFSIADFSIGVTTLALLLLWPRINKKIPAPLVVLTIMAIIVEIVNRFYPEFGIATIGTEFKVHENGQWIPGIPQSLPHLTLPWSFSGPDGKPFDLTYAHVKALIPSAFAIALLGAIESLLSAVVADGMKQTRHDPNAELTALGIGNILCPFLGGIAATGAISRTATNIRYGAESPLSSIMHAGFVFVAVLALSPAVSYLPMAALAALVLLVAYHMADVKHFYHILRVSPRSDVLVLLMCFGLTVIFDMVVGVAVGMVLAAMMFMRRMAALTEARVLQHNEQGDLKLPPEILLYQIAGPMFFGAAQKTAETLGVIEKSITTVIFDMCGMPIMDVTGLVAFETTINRLISKNVSISIVGLHDQPKKLLTKAEIIRPSGHVKIFRSLNEAIKEVRCVPG